MAKVFGFDRIRRSVAEGRMEIGGVVIDEPAFEGREEGGRAGPLAQPDQLLLEGPEEPLGVGVALGVAIAGEGLPDAHGGAGAHEGELAAVVGHQVDACAPPCRWSRPTWRGW